MISKLARRFFLGGASAVAIIAGAALNAATFDFSFTGAMQSDTTTQSGTYRISIGGASGGGAIFSGFSGGTGARILGDVYLGAGSYFKVLVGGNGESGESESGGGGMSYFRAGANLAVAGGGGGATFRFAGGNGGASASDGGGIGGGGAGTAGNTGGGGSVSGNYFGTGGGGGAGIDQNGGDAFFLPGEFGGGGQTGPTFAGGTGWWAGGFGGGGGGSGNYWEGAGGGGGYFGGGGGYFGGGGSSHFSSLFTNTSMFDGGATSGAYVSVDFIGPAISPVPLPAGALLMGTALGGLAMMRRRKTAKSAVNKT